MEKLTITSDETVEVTINDSGFSIKLNPLDIDFPLKLQETLEEINHLEEKLKEKLKAIDKGKDTDQGLLTTYTREKLLLLRDFNNECGELVDKLFGAGMVQAAFNGANYLGMYNDLFTSLTPVIDKVYGDSKAIMERFKAKYTKGDNDILK